MSVVKLGVKCHHSIVCGEVNGDGKPCRKIHRIEGNGEGKVPFSLSGEVRITHFAHVWNDW